MGKKQEFDSTYLKVEEDWIPEFVDSLAGWKQLPRAARDVACDLIQTAMDTGRAKKGGAQVAAKLATALIKPCVLDLLKRNPSLALRDDLAHLWVAANPAWWNSLRPWAAENGWTVWDPSTIRPKGLENISGSELDSAVFAAPKFLDDRPELRRLVLHISLVRPVRVTAQASAAHRDAPVLPPALEKWLEVVSSWDPEAPEWEGLPFLMNSAERMREEKRKTKLLLRLEKITISLAKLRQPHILEALREARLFDLETRILEWEVGSFAVETVNDAAVVIDRLAELLGKVKEAIVVPGLSPEESRRRRGALHTLENDLFLACDDVEPFLVNSRAALLASNLLAPVSSPVVRPPPGPNAAPLMAALPAPLPSVHVPAPLVGGLPPQPERVAAVAPLPATQPHPERTEEPSTSAAATEPSPADTPQSIAHEEEPPPAPETAVLDALPLPSRPSAPTASGPRPKAPLLEAAAQAVIDKPGDEGARFDLVLALVDAKDFAAACWVVRTMLLEGQTPPFSKAVLHAVMGAFLMPSTEGEILQASLLELVSANLETSAFSFEDRCLALACAFRLAPVAPMAGARAWLSEDVFSRLRNLVEAVRTFADANGTVPENVQARLETTEQRTARIQSLARSAQAWKRRAVKFTTQHSQATRVWQALLDGSVGDALSIPAQNGRTQVDALTDRLKVFATDELRRNLIETTRRELRCPSPIIGAALRKLLRDTEEGYQLAARWREAVQSEQTAGQVDRLTLLLEDLRNVFQRELLPAERALDEAALRADSVSRAVAIRVLRSAIDWLAVRLGLREKTASLPPATERAWSVIDTTRSLASVFAQRLKLLPRLALPSDDSSWDSMLGPMPLLIAQDVLEKPSIAQVLQKWIEQADFRFVQDLLEQIDNEEEQDRLRAFVLSEMTRRRALLRQQVFQTEAEIEQAFIDGIIGHRERSELMDDIKQLKDRVDTSPRLHELHDQVGTILGRIANARQAGLEGQRELWTKLRKDLEGRPIDVAAVEVRVQNGLMKGDVRSVDELLSHLRLVAEGERDFSPELFVAATPERHLEHFLERVAVYEKAIGTARGREIVQRLDAANSSVPPGVRQEMKRALEAWGKLDDARNNQQRVVGPVRDILAFVGFEILVAPERIERIKTGAVCQVKLSSRGMSALPEFGSKLASGSIDVVCVWPIPGVSALQNVLSAFPADDSPRIVIYAGHLSKQERHRLRADLKKSTRAAIVLDEWLFYFLELFAPGERLTAFLQAALPWTQINPYVTRSIVVPPEMFFGRDEMVTALSDVGGSYIVYGGRQLGKSALLEHVERRNSGAQGRFALRMDIKSVGDPSAVDRNTGALFLRLRDELQHLKLLPQKVSTEPRNIMRQIVTELENRRARLIVLLDEADNFLDADARRGFESVIMLREAMVASKGGLKVVLAGLHNVQRFQGIPNQPFAQLGTARHVGPLEPKAADALIRRPLEALGYRFGEGVGARLHILSYTNYHPGLLQLFCQHLLQQLRQKGDGGQLPFTITPQHVEEVYLKREVQTEIRERFLWTLALDPRYRALAFAAILAQDEDDTSHSKALSVAEFLEAGNYWWSAAFEPLKTDDVRGLLEEMVGLGVLAPSGANRYRLRSPNVVRLLGAREDIENSLQELEQMTPPAAFLPDHQHEWLDSGPPRAFRVSPFSIAQERQLIGDTSGVILVFGSEATGLSDVPLSLKAIVERAPVGARDIAVEFAPSSVTEPKEFLAFLRKFDKETDDSVSRLLVHHTISEKVAERGELLLETQTFLGKRDEKDRSLRVVFSMPAPAAWRWLSAKSRASAREEFPQLVLRRWTRDGIRKLLNDTEMPHDERAVERVLGTTTGGWPVLLRSFVGQNNGSVANSASESFERLLTTNRGHLNELWRSLGIEGLTPVVIAVRALHEADAPFERPEQIVGLLGTAEATVVAPLANAVVALLDRLDVLEHQGGMHRLAPLVGRAMPGSP